MNQDVEGFALGNPVRRHWLYREYLKTLRQGEAPEGDPPAVKPCEPSTPPLLKGME